LIDWASLHITAVVTVATQMVSELEADEFAVANNTADAESARERIGWLTEGISYSSWPYEDALTWHRRYTDLFVYLRGLAGEISPPRPVDNDVIPPIMRRRGATAGLEDLDPADNPEPTDYFDPLATSDDQATPDYLLGPDSMAGSPVDLEPHPEDPANVDWLFGSNGIAASSANAEPTDHSDFLPPPGFYTWPDDFDWFNPLNYDPQKEESADEDDDETMGEPDA
jgi:hypothetical protein